MTILNINNRVVGTIKILTYTLLLFSVLTKLFCIPYISNKFQILGISEYCYLFGTIELLATVAFFFDGTIGLGLMLLSSYFGGAIATDIQSPGYLYQPIIVITLVFITTLIRKPSLFHARLRMISQSRRSTIIFNNH